MINKTNKTLVLENGKKYVIIRQIAYKGRTFFIAGRINDEETDIQDEIRVLEEITENNETYVTTVKDTSLLDTIYKHLENTEFN